MKLKPVRNLCVFELVPQELRSRGGIFIPETAKRYQYKVGRVLAVGPGRIGHNNEYVVPAVQVGDLCILGEHSGIDMEYDGEKVFMADADEVLSIVNETPKLDS